MADEHPSFRRWLAAAVGLGAVVRVAWLIDRWNQAIGFEDAFFYHHQANLLADGHGFISPFPFLATGTASPAAEHPPLYSLYLSIWSYLGATSVGWHQVATTLLGIGTVALIGLAGRKAAGDRVGIVAAFVAAIYPHLWYQDGIVWAEAMAQATVALFVLVAFTYVRRPSPRTLATLGLTAALAAMARTELVLLLPLGVVPLALWTEPMAMRRKLRWMAVGLGAGLVALVPWSAFNLARFDRPTTLSSNLGLTLASANCDTTWYGPTIGYWDFRCAQAAGTEQVLTGGDPSEIDAAARGEALSYVKDHADRLPAVLAARTLRTAGLWSPRQQAQLDELEGRPEPIARAGIGLWWITAASAAVGVVAMRRRGLPTWPAIAPIIAMWLGVLTAFASTRYRASAEPAVVVLAAAGCVWMVDRWVRRRSGGTRAGTSERRQAESTQPSSPSARNTTTTATTAT